MSPMPPMPPPPGMDGAFFSGFSAIIASVVISRPAIEAASCRADAAARDDAFLDRGAGRMHRVVNAILALLDLDLGRTADADDRNAAGQLGQTLLRLLLSRR